MVQYEQILKKFESEIIQSIQNYELLDDIRFEILNSVTDNNSQVVFYANAAVEINDLTIEVYEFTPEHEPLLLQCHYEEPNGLLQFEIVCNVEDMTLQINGSKLKLSDQASHSVHLVNQDYKDDEYERLNKYVQEEIDTDNRLDFPRLFRQMDEIKVNETFIE